MPPVQAHPFGRSVEHLAVAVDGRGHSRHLIVLTIFLFTQSVQPIKETRVPALIAVAPDGKS